MAQPDTLRFSLLGPVRAWRGSAEVDVGTPGEQAVLAMLLLNDGRPIGVADIVDGWGPEAPRGAAGLVRSYVSRLRTALEGTAAVLRVVDGTFALCLPDGALDVAAFERDARAARVVTEPDRTAELLRAALSGWQGEPLTGVPGPYAEVARERLTERRLQVLTERLDVDLRLGRHEQSVDELTVLCAEYPLREELRALLMLALFRCGRGGEALAGYADTAKLLSSDYGIDPGPELVALNQRILRSDETLAAPLTRPGPAQPTPARPHQLPADTADFTGRERMVAELVRALDRGPAAIVSPLPGVGRTSLAVHVAHQARQRFPDGQWYAAVGDADAEAVLAGLLRALGVTEAAIPTGVAARTALYRSVLTGRRVLIVLDDVRDAAQLRPLLPATAGCAVLVTSATALAEVPMSRRVELGVLPPEDAVTLLGRIVGEDRVAAQRAAALDVVCEHGLSPLAVRIVGARLAARPAWPIESLRGSAGTQDAAAALRSAYGLLDPLAARAFRLFCVLDVTDIGVAAAAAALDLPRYRAAEVLARLADLALLESGDRERYRCHGVVRAFGRRESDRLDSAAVHTAVLARYLDFQLATARSAYRVLRPGHGIPDLLGPTMSVGTFIDRREDALDWAAHECVSTLAVVRQSAGHIGLVRVAANLLVALAPLLELDFRWHEAIDPARALLPLAEYARDPIACGRIAHVLGTALLRLDRLAEADELTARAATVSTATRDTLVLAGIRHVRGLIMVLRKNFPAAVDELDQAAELAASVDSEWPQAMALLDLAVALARSGAVVDAVDSCYRGMDLLLSLGDPFGEGYALCTQGRVLQRTGDYDTAIGVFLRSVAVARANRLPVFEIVGVVEIAGCHLAAGRHADALAWAEQGRAAAARVYWERVEADALTVLGRSLAGLGEPERSQSFVRKAQAVRGRLGPPGGAQLSTGPW